MNTAILVFIGVIVADLVLVVEIIYIFAKRAIGNKLISALFERNEEKFESAANSFFAKLLSKFEKEEIRFNVYLIQKDYNKLEDTISRIDNLKLSNRQIKKIYPRIFYYYIDRSKYVEAKKVYEKLSIIKVYKDSKDVERTYDAYIKGGYQYLDDALKDLKRARPEQLPVLEKCIAKMYENKKINSEAKKYYRLSEKHQREIESKKR